MDEDIILSLKGLTKRYPGVVANHDIHLDIRRGEVHTLIGENGAGKSTLIKCLSGAVIPDEGKIVWEGKEYSSMTPKESRELGIAIVYQELCLVNSLSIAENICLGESHRGVFVNFAYQRKIALDTFKDMGIAMDPSAKVGDLSTAQQQLVEIAKAISHGARLLVLDEPTAPLTSEEIENLFKIMDVLKKKNVTMIYISHRMDEIFRVSDRITVLRDGEAIKTLEAAQTNRTELISLMVGRTLSETYPQRKPCSPQVALEVRNLSGIKNRDINLIIYKGEIVGIGGLLGAGRTELARMIYGLDPKTSGEIFLDGKKVTINSPKKAIDYHIGMIPEDRKRQGVLLRFGIDWNTTLSCIRRLSRFGFMNFKKIDDVAQTYIDDLQIMAPSRKVLVETLSGGNQQKVVLAKTLATESNVIIFDEPTRGIDVGAKQEIYSLMVKLASQGKAILLISSDMPELLGMSDRIYVMAEGRIAGELTGNEITQVKIMEMISSASENSVNKNV